MDWLLLIVVVAGLGAVIGVAAALLGASMPAPENRPAPRERLADLEEARDAALRKIAARARRLDERDAAARISRGW